MNCNETFDIAKDDNVWETLIEEYSRRRAIVYICDVGYNLFSSINIKYVNVNLRDYVNLFYPKWLLWQME